MVSVQPSKESMHAIPVNAQRRIRSSLSVKFLRYHVATPRIEQADISNHQPSGMVGATTSPSLGCRLKSQLWPKICAVLYRWIDAPTSCARQSRRDAGPIFSIFRNRNPLGFYPICSTAIHVWNHSCNRLLPDIPIRMDCALVRISRSTGRWSCLGCKREVTNEDCTEVIGCRSR